MFALLQEENIFLTDFQMGNGQTMWSTATWCSCGDTQHAVISSALYPLWCLGSIFTFFPCEGVLLGKLKSKMAAKHPFWQSPENPWKSVLRGDDLKPELCLHYLQEKAELGYLDKCWEDLSKVIISTPRAFQNKNLCSLIWEDWMRTIFASHLAMMEMALTSTVSICFTAIIRKNWAKPWRLPWVVM